MSRQPVPVLEKVVIQDVAAEGNAVARVNDLVVFVPFAVPGDVVDLKVISRKRNFCVAKVLRFHSYSPLRKEPFCRHFGTCGGCKWQVLPYEEQLKYKQKQVEDNFRRIGKFEFPSIRPILASPDQTEYRNKLEFTFSNRRWFTDKDFEESKQVESENLDLQQNNALGFHISQLFDRVLDIEKCYLQPGNSNLIRNKLRGFALDNGLTFYDHRNHTGILRTLLIRNTHAGDEMVIVVFGEDEPEAIEKVMKFIETEFPHLYSLMYVVNLKKNDTISDLEIQLWKGNPFLIETLKSPVEGFSELKFKIGPVSFFQTNPLQAYHLYKTAFDFAGFTGNETVYDLYCGTGSITNFIARSVKKAVGVEYVEAAVEDARFNSQLNEIENTVFYSGDLAKVLSPEFIEQNGKPDIIITDPPRAGMHEKVVKQIIESGVPKIVYVSCNPATQARDIALMNEWYEVKAVQPVDMFPHTHHVENVVLLNNRRTGTS